MPTIPDGFHVVDRYDGTRPDDRECLNEDEVFAAYDAARAMGVPQPVVACGYCGGTTRSRDRDKAVAWFHDHACRTDELQAHRNRAIMAEHDLNYPSAA